MPQVKRGNRDPKKGKGSGKKGKVRNLQRHNNATLNKAELDWLRTEVDGVAGDGTFKAARLVASWKGLTKEQLKKISNGVITPHVYAILTGEKPRTKAMKRRSRQRRDAFAKVRKHHNHPPEDRDGISTWRGRDIAAWMVGAATGPDGTRTNWLQKSVDRGWDGVLYSAFRDPAYSESLCWAMCDQPSCPGMCAGRASNHSQVGPPNWGAIDVASYTTFGRIQREIGSPLKNALPNDRPHYSYTGA